MTFEDLVRNVRACRLCQASLVHGAKPVLQVHPRALILVAGQAPGLKVHLSGVPFKDDSGVRLREWLGVSENQFYNPGLFAIVPMGFCYPGKGKTGDLPPRPECAPAWRSALLAELSEIRLTLLVGQYAQNWHLGTRSRERVTETVAAWRDSRTKGCFPLPHPSPRNRVWLQRNPWFEKELLPELKQRVQAVLASRESPPPPKSVRDGPTDGER